MTASPEATMLIVSGLHEHRFIDQLVSGKLTRA